METWFLIVGLGNPGAEYERTRHNAGFMVLDQLGVRHRASWSFERKFQAELAKVDVDGRRVVLCRPQTFMNASGESVGPLASFYKVPLERVLVVVDDADLPLGEIRMRPSGSSGGHHGLESIEHHVGSREFARQRIGIGRQAGGTRQIAGYVLSPFQPGERPVLEKVLHSASEQVECWLASGPGPAMNRFNGMVKG